MGLIEQLDEQEYADGLALRALRADEAAWGAFTRLLKKLDEDYITQWSADETGKKKRKWLNGVREALAEIVPTIERKIQNSETMIEEQRALREESRSRGADGSGSGDLAIS